MWNVRYLTVVHQHPLDRSIGRAAQVAGYFERMQRKQRST